MREKTSPHPEWYMQDVGSVSCSVGRQIYVAPLCARSSGRSYLQRDLSQRCGLKGDTPEYKLHTWYQGRQHTICVISGLRLFLSRSRGRRRSELAPWPHRIAEHSNGIHDM